jgi:hypothetical protein
MRSKGFYIALTYIYRHLVFQLSSGSPCLKGRGGLGEWDRDKGKGM